MQHVCYIRSCWSSSAAQSIAPDRMNFNASGLLYAECFSLLPVMRRLAEQAQRERQKLKEAYCTPAPYSQAAIFITRLLRIQKLAFASVHSEEQEKLSLNTLIHTLQSTEKYSTNSKTTKRCIRKFSNRVSTVKNLQLQTSTKNTEQMFLKRAFWELTPQEIGHNTIDYTQTFSSVSLKVKCCHRT